MSYRSKRLSLHRAYFNEGFNGTIENTLRELFSRLSSAKERIVDIDMFSSQGFVSIEDSEKTGGVLVRVLSFEQGAMGVINFETTDFRQAVEEFYHPDKKDFLKDEVVFLARRDHVVACNLGNKSGTLASGVIQLAQRGEFLSSDVHMRIADVPDKTTLDRINRVGVREVDFSITSFMESLDISTSGQVGGRVIRMIFGVPMDNATVRKRANAVGRMILKRGHFSADEIKKDEWLTSVGEEIVVADSSERYSITLEDGAKISNSKMKISKVAKLKRHANSYDYESAKLHLENYFNELSDRGSLD